ncbi:MAG: ABC transporter substrate-binding protein [Phycisphaerales bacterium]|nr:ABC transporter substrate-binding protein [Phycisphaerales bacterium]
MSIRTLTLTILLVVPAIALLAVGPKHRDPVPPGRTVVRYWEKWTGVEGAAIETLVDRFNATAGAEAGVWVECSAVSNIEQRLLIAIAGGDPPDVAGLVDSRIPQYADQNALLALDELVREDGIQLDSFKPIWIDLCRYDGRLYALPSTPFTIALFYNRTLFREAGLDPDSPPRTLDELNAAAVKLTKRDATGRITQLGFTVSNAMLGWWPWVWPGFFGGRLWDGQRYNLDSPEGRAAAAWIGELRATLDPQRCIDFESTAGAIESAQNPFMAGKLAMLFQGPWFSNWIRKYTPDLDYAVAPFPSSTPEGDNVFASEDVFVIPRGAPHAREAMTFLKWVAAQPQLEELCRSHGKVSPFKSPAPAFFDGHPNPFVRVFDAMAASPRAFGFPQMPMWAQVESELLAAHARLLSGRQTPDAVVSETQQRLDAVVAEYQRMAARRRGSDR